MFFTSCAYHIGNQVETAPGGVRSISVPMFKNMSNEVSAEVQFTNALIQEFDRSKTVHVVADNSDAVMSGVITKIEYLVPATSLKLAQNTTYMPNGTVLATDYNLTVEVELKLIRRIDQKVVWTNTFVGVRSYSSPQVTLPVVNSVNPLYNLSARRQNISLLAAELMSEAHDRMLENF